MNLINGLLLGLSTGIFCFSYCAPVYLPQVLGTKSKFKGWDIFLKFNLGRLLAYMIFGALFGYLGENAHSLFLKNFSDIITIILSLLLILYGLGFGFKLPKFCCFAKKVRLAFLSGFLLGINICPPFLLALLYNFKIGGILNGIAFFIFFFLGTTLYLVPITFLGSFAKYEWLMRSARLSAVIIGLFLILNALYG